MYGQHLCTYTKYGGAIILDGGSKWIATGDSKVILGADVEMEQIDAAEGITIRARGAEIGTYKLASGGTLVVK